MVNTEKLKDNEGENKEDRGREVLSSGASNRLYVCNKCGTAFRNLTSIQNIEDVCFHLNK